MVEIKEFLKINELEDNKIQVKGQFVIKTDDKTKSEVKKLGYVKKVREDGSVEVEING